MYLYVYVCIFSSYVHSNTPVQIQHHQVLFHLCHISMQTQVFMFPLSNKQKLLFLTSSSYLLSGSVLPCMQNTFKVTTLKAYFTPTRLATMKILDMPKMSATFHMPNSHILLGRQISCHNSFEEQLDNI